MVFNFILTSMRHRVIGKRFSSSLSVVLKGNLVEVKWPDKPAPSQFHLSWLRDNCYKSIHPSTRQKLLSSGQISNYKNPKLSWTDDKLTLDWLDGSGNGRDQSIFDFEWLKEHDYSHERSRLIDPIVWDAEAYRKAHKPIDYAMFDGTDDGLDQALINLRDYGLCFLRNVPIQYKCKVEAIAQKFGPIMETFYGRSWDVKSVSNSKNIAYTSLNLGFHMDLLYFESPPGLQFLHCLENTVTGGESIFLDVFKAVEILKNAFPEDYQILTEIPVTFHYRNDGHHMRFTRPTIIQDDINDGLKVFYAPQFQAPLNAPSSKVDAFYKAFNRFEGILANPKLTFKIRMQPRDCVIFLNQRVLHGRTEFDPESGARHLKGTYVGIDEFKDKVRFRELHFNQTIC